ncbi:gamma-glutamyl-gamma-aminobutyrate hydrolase family protein [Nitrospinota bacterium]
MKRIGLTQRVEVVPSYGERRDCLDQRWADLLESLGYCPVPLPNKIDQVEEYVWALDLHGFVLSGGGDLACTALPEDERKNIAPERDRLEAELLRIASRNYLPVLGVCRGMQAINVHYGGRIMAAPGHTGSTHAVNPTANAFVFFERDFTVNSFHNFVVPADGLAPDFLPVAACDDGTLEAMCHPTWRCNGVMWHPERYPELPVHDRELIRLTFE